MVSNSSPPSSVLIDLNNVSKTYQTSAGAFPALKNISLRFHRGEFVGVIGKSGSGKSTLVNMITGIDRPSEGKVFVDGLDVHAMRESQQARWRGMNLGVVFQFFQLLPMLTLVENVLLPMDFCDKYEPNTRLKRAMDLLAMVGLENQAYQLPNAVSGGQQQSAAIARALANDPPIIIADEPTGNLDAKTADSVYDKFSELSDEGRTIIMITHDPDIEQRLSRTVLLSDGKIVDPLLVRSFPWLPQPVLRRLGQHLSRQEFTRGTILDTAGTLARQFILIENGKIQIEFVKKHKRSKKVILTSGNYFAGKDLIPEKKWREFQAQVVSGYAEIALLSPEKLYSVMEDLPEGNSKLEAQLRKQLLGLDDENNEGGIIR